MRKLIEEKTVKDALACEKILSALGLCARARKLTIGAQLTLAEIEKGNVKIAVLTEDISDNTAEKLIRKLEKHSVPYIVLSKSSGELAQRLGKTGLVCAASVLGEGFDNIIYNALKNI